MCDIVPRHYDDTNGMRIEQWDTILKAMLLQPLIDLSIPENHETSHPNTMNTMNTM